MSAGLYSLHVVAEFLGKRPEDLTAMIKDDGLPVIKVPTATRHAQKVSLLGLHGWLVKRSVNTPLTVDELEEELDRAAAALAARFARRLETNLTRCGGLKSTLHA